MIANGEVFVDIAAVKAGESGTVVSEPRIKLAHNMKNILLMVFINKVNS